MRLKKTSVFMALSLCLLLPEALAHHDGHTTAGAMINSPTASTLGRNRLSAGFAFNNLRYNSVPAGDAHRLHHEGRDIHGKNHEEGYNIDLGYGVLNDLDVYLTAPIVSKNSIEVDRHRTLGKKESATGFGDMRLTGKYRFWEKHVEAALISGIKFPTGRTAAKRDSGDKFAPENQPGSGSWDAEFGLALSRGFRKHFLAAASFQYFLKTEGAQGHEGGDAFRGNLGFSYAVKELGKYPNLSVVFELNHEWALKDRSRAEVRVFDSGGTAVFATPGLNAALTRRASLFWGMPVPVYQNLGGEHEELKLETLAGINFYF